MADDSRNSGNKLPGTGRNTTLYIVLAGIGILGFFYWSVQSSILKIAPRQFEQLVKKSSRIADGGELATESDGITHETGTGESVKTLRLRELRDVRVYEKVIVGIVDKQVLMDPDRVHPVRFRVGWMSQIFNAGHRIRVTVASTGSPLYEPNPQTGKPATIEFPADARKAINTIHHGSRYSSRILAPLRVAGSR